MNINKEIKINQTLKFTINFSIFYIYLIYPAVSYLLSKSCLYSCTTGFETSLYFSPLGWFILFFDWLLPIVPFAWIIICVCILSWVVCLKRLAMGYNIILVTAGLCLVLSLFLSVSNIQFLIIIFYFVFIIRSARKDKYYFNLRPYLGD